MTDTIRLPQRFQYRSNSSERWRDGVCFPMECHGVRYWSIRAGAGHGSFDDDPWEMVGRIIGDVSHFRWIDNDYGWLPAGGTCCGTTFDTADDLREHLRLCHGESEP